MGGGGGGGGGGSRCLIHIVDANSTVSVLSNKCRHSVWVY